MVTPYTYAYIPTLIYYTLFYTLHPTSKGYTHIPLLYYMYSIPYTTHLYTPLLIYSVYSLCIIYYIWFSYIVLLYYSARVILYMKVTLLACVYTCKACFYSCIVNFITITLYVPETLAILVFHTSEYTCIKYCKYSSAPCNSK